MAIDLHETAERRAQRIAAKQAILDLPEVDVETVCLATGRAQRVVRTAIASGEIASIRVGRSLRIPTAPLRRAWGIEA